jgi:hypothetical protein
MRQYLHTWQTLEHDLAERYGAFALFALLEREEAPHLWDIVVAAPWLEHPDIDALDIIAKAINAHFDQDIYHHISHIAPVTTDHPALPALLEMVAHEQQSVNSPSSPDHLDHPNSVVALYQRRLLDKDIARAFIISAQPASTMQLVGD